MRKPNLPKGTALARRKGFPSLPRFACADFRYAPPSGWVHPSLAPCYPAFARRRSACLYMPTCLFKSKSKSRSPSSPIPPILSTRSLATVPKNQVFFVSEARNDPA